MARMTKAQARRRLMECQKKIMVVISDVGHQISNIDIDKLWKIRRQLRLIESKLK